MSLEGSNFTLCEAYIFVEFGIDLTGRPVRLKYHYTDDE